MAAWIVLSDEWTLQDVQAGLNVVINIICFTFIFISAWLLCHKSTKKLARQEDIPVSSMFSLTTPGEVVDIIGLLQMKIFARVHFRIALQCGVVIFFSLAATFAGPISRYSTRAGQAVRLRPVTGLQASRTLSCDVNDNLRWQEVFNRLENAKFPRDRLLDYLPDTRTDWVYQPVEWNSIYLADCVINPRTSIEVEMTGNYTDSVLYLYDQIPALWAMLSPRFHRDDIIHQTWYDGLRNPEIGLWEHVMIFQYVDLRSANESHEQNASTQETTLSIGILYMQNAPEYNLTVSGIDSQDWVFGIGRVPQAYYSKVECDIRRNRPEDDNLWEAYPQIRTNCNLAREMDTYWSVTAIVPADGSGEKFTINMPSSEDLLRFYQSYMIAKDTYYPFPSAQQTSVRVSTVELSIAFIVVCGLILLVVLYGLLHWGSMRWKYRGVLHSIPVTKVDWVLQSIQESRTISTTQLQSQNQPETTMLPLAQVLEPRSELWLSANYTAKQNAITDAFGKLYSANAASVNEKTPNAEPADQGEPDRELSISACQSERPGPEDTPSHPPSGELQLSSKSKPAVSVSVPDT